MVRWGLYRDGKRWIIRRGREEVLPIKKYRRIRHDEEKLRQLVQRLNAPLDTKKAVAFKHAFISPDLLGEYQDYLLAQIPNQANARAEYQAVYKHFLMYFISKLNLMNPSDWYDVHKTRWAKYLQSKDVPASSKSKKQIIQGANRFMHWLHERRPEEVRQIKFEPLSKAVLKNIDAMRELSGEMAERKSITNKDFRKILFLVSKPHENPKLDFQYLKPFILLGYYYGLRRCETLGARNGDVHRGYLHCQRQLVKLDVLKPLKGREFRKIPHWHVRANRVPYWIKAITENQIHPTTLTNEWNRLMEDLDLDYDFHDLRHTFITRNIAVQHARDVQLAAGHENIETTMRYAHDARTLNDEVLSLAS